MYCEKKLSYQTAWTDWYMFLVKIRESLVIAIPLVAPCLLDIQKFRYGIPCSQAVCVLVGASPEYDRRRQNTARVLLDVASSSGGRDQLNGDRSH
ncbi:hypothetical protein LINPERHAP1_LOCUS31870 [Linum perenne]